MSIENLPCALILDILSRLPANSIAKCRCVSRLWSSLLKLDCPYFTELFFTHSKTRPRLLLAVQKNNDEWGLYSSPQPQNSSTNSNSSISVTPEFHMSFPKTWLLNISHSVSGLIYFSNMPNFNNPTLCNPSTGYFFPLPNRTRTVHNFFGYDPINKQFSVLDVSYLLPWDAPSSYQILKLGSGKPSWKNLKCPLRHYPSLTNICINGILYYIAMFDPNHHTKIVSFDLNSEEFKFIGGHHWPPSCNSDVLVNYKGKLGRINMDLARSHVKLSLWVLEDVEKHEWSERVYHHISELWNTHLCILGVTRMGEVVLSLDYISHPFCVYFCNLEKKIIQTVEIKGFEEFRFKHHIFFGRVDHIEELRVLNWG